MGKCSICKKEILYNKFKRYRGNILCYDCYDKRLERKREKKKVREAILDQENIEDKVTEWADPMSNIKSKKEPEEDSND